MWSRSVRSLPERRSSCGPPSPCRRRDFLAATREKRLSSQGPPREGLHPRAAEGAQKPAVTRVEPKTVEQTEEDREGEGREEEDRRKPFGKGHPLLRGQDQCCCEEAGEHGFGVPAVVGPEAQPALDEEEGGAVGQDEGRGRGRRRAGYPVSGHEQ